MQMLPSGLQAKAAKPNKIRQPQENILLIPLCFLANICFPYVTKGFMVLQGMPHKIYASSKRKWLCQMLRL